MKNLWRFILISCLCVSSDSFAARIELTQFCPILAGQWAGSAAKSGMAPRQVQTSVMCSHDKRNLILSVSKGDTNPYSETWWFRQQGTQVLLTYSNGAGEDRQQLFSLYQQGETYSLLGEGSLNQRPALIRLEFLPLDSVTLKPEAEPKKSVTPQSKQASSWLWRQSAHYLDDDSQRYQLIRGIELTANASH
ncbi:hypothetical protein [Shewanella donghaensis]|uniref:hypothetical protein n=1 Tax=Shewanella donghaensis TaxID=238836 RepID=UPI00118447E8|nr:hypothetical protein [Shewanella donghaensis]